jgi:uncharacterized protein YcfJ
MKILLLTLVLLSGCATQGIDRADQNKITKEFYASVISIEQVKLSSEVGSGIVGGAAIGVIDELDGNREDMIAGGLVGALIGGFFTALFEGSNEAYQYTLNSAVEGEFSIIQKERIDTTTACVKVRIGNKASISAVAEDNCNIP